MHHNRSLLPNVEVLLGVMVKTSTCSNKLLFVILNFYSRLFSWFWSNFTISKFLTKFHNFNLNFEFQLDFINLIKFHNLAKNPENGQFLQWIYIWNVLGSAPPSYSCKIFGTYATKKSPRHLHQIVFWSAMGPNGPKMPIFGQKKPIFDQIWPFLG